MQGAEPDIGVAGGLSLEAAHAVHLAVIACLVWSHGAYRESEVKLTLVWDAVAGSAATALMLDRSCLDEFPAEDRAPREANVVDAVMKVSAKPGALRPYADVVSEAIADALEATTAPLLCQLCLPASSEMEGARTRRPSGLVSAGGARQLPHCPLSDMPVFCFLSGLEPPRQEVGALLQIETVRWPSCLAPAAVHPTVAATQTVYALQHLHTEGLLLPALEEDFRRTERAQEAGPTPVSIHQAQCRALGVLPPSSEAGPDGTPLPTEDILEEESVQVCFRIAARRQTLSYLFIEADAASGAGQEEHGELQVFALRRALVAAGDSKHFTLLKERTRVGDSLTVIGRCGIARGTRKPTLFLQKVVRVESREEPGASAVGSAVVNGAGDELIVHQAKDLLVVHKATGTSTFWPARREKGNEHKAAVAGSGPPLIKIVGDWASQSSAGEFVMVAPLRQDPSGLVLFAKRASPLAGIATRSKVEPHRRFLALIGGKLPESDEIGRIGQVYRCHEPLRQLGASGKPSSQASGQQPADSSASASRPCEGHEEEEDKPAECGEPTPAVSGLPEGYPQPSQADANAQQGKKPPKLDKKPPKLEALTEFETIGFFGDAVVPGSASLVVATPRTRVAEQVRRHLQLMGCPICCDKQYGDFRINRRFAGVFGLPRAFEHCFEIDLPSAWAEASSVETVRCPLPRDLRSLLESLTAKDSGAVSAAAAEWIGLTGGPPQQDARGQSAVTQ